MESAPHLQPQDTIDSTHGGVWWQIPTHNDGNNEGNDHDTDDEDFFFSMLILVQTLEAGDWSRLDGLASDN